MKKNIIWSNINLKEEDWKEDYEEWLEDNELTYETTPTSLSQWMEETNTMYLDDEKSNLNVGCGKILAIAQLGLWNGHRQGYKILKGGNLTDIFTISEQGSEYYCDSYNVRGTFIHHDGRNTVLFREIKDNVDVTPLLNKIWEGKDINSNTLCRYTKSLRPYVKDVYGFK